MESVRRGKGMLRKNSLHPCLLPRDTIRTRIDDLLPLLRPGHGLILRSTIAPGTTEFVAGYIEKQRGLRAGAWAAH